MNTDDLIQRIAFVQDTFKQPAIVEDFIDGREFHVTLWGNSNIEMLPPAEMDFAAFNNLRDRLCTFDSKFKPGSLHYEKIDMRIPAILTDQETRRLKQTAMQAYQVTGCRDYDSFLKNRNRNDSSLGDRSNLTLAFPIRIETFLSG